MSFYGMPVMSRNLRDFMESSSPPFEFRKVPRESEGIPNFEGKPKTPKSRESR
jgi:hypothetical protein